MQQVAAALKLLRPSQIDGEQLIREEEIKKHRRGARHTRQEANEGGDKSVCGLVKLRSQKKLMISILIGSEKQWQQVAGRPLGFTLLLIDWIYNLRIVIMLMKEAAQL